MDKLWTPPMNRRDALRAMGFGAAVMAAPAARGQEASGGAMVYLPDFRNQKAKPKFAWENYEDMMYHDLEFSDPELETEPEFVAFMKHVWTFNRAMQWVRDEATGAILCYSKGPRLSLTGEARASEWISDGRNAVKHAGEGAVFEKRSPRPRDCAVLPAFQIHLRQHPAIDIEVTQANAEWQFCVGIKGRSGPPLLTTGWRKGAGKARLDIAAAIARRGYALQYAELHFVMGVWTGGSGAADVSWRASMKTQPAIVCALPSIRTERNAGAAGVPVTAMTVDASGEPSDEAIKATVGGREVALERKGSCSAGTARGLAVGEHACVVSASGFAQATTVLRVSDGKYLSYDREHRFMKRDGKLLGPMTGSYQGTFFFESVGSGNEVLVNGQEQWDKWDRTKAPGERLHYWESLTEKELDRRFAYLRECGWDLTHLHSNWGQWGRLDAGGKLSPFGAEQLALYIRVGARHGLMHHQSLSSYQYALKRDLKLIGGTPPWSAYVEAGFQDEQMYKPAGTPFQRLFRQYLHDFVSVFREETALGGMQANGEGDHEIGPEFVNDVFHYVRSLDPNHFFPAEPHMSYSRLPSDQAKGFVEDVFGDRTYGLGERVDIELDLGVAFKLLQTGHNYLAEGDWATPSLYTAMHYLWLKNDHKDPGPQSWVGTEYQRAQVRDTFYLGLVHKMPIMNTWDEHVTEDEHKVLRMIRDQVDWSQPFAKSPLTMRINAWNAAAGRKHLLEYERALSRMPLMCRYVLEDDPEETLLDARAPFGEPQFAGQGGRLPDLLQERMPVQLCAGYSAAYLQSEDGKTLIAYLYNTSHHFDRPFWIQGRYRRVGRPVDARFGVRNLPGARLRYRLYNLVSKTLENEGAFTRTTELALGRTAADYLLLVTS